MIEKNAKKYGAFLNRNIALKWEWHYFTVI